MEQWGGGKEMGNQLAPVCVLDFEGNVGDTAKRTVVSGLWEAETLSGVLASGAASGLSTWVRAYCSHPCLCHSISRPWLCPGSSSASRMFRSKGWMDVWAEGRGEKTCIYVNNYKMVVSSPCRVLGWRSTYASCAFSVVVTQRKWWTQEGGGLQGQFLREGNTLTLEAGVGIC